MVTVPDVLVMLGETACTWNLTVTGVGGGGGGGGLLENDPPPPPPQPAMKIKSSSANAGTLQTHGLLSFGLS
jgi:hypothetical protein